MNGSMVAVVRWTMRVVFVVLVVVAAVMMLAVVIVIVIPDVNPVAAVLVAPFDLRLEVGALSVFVAFNCVVRVAASVAKVPGVWVGNACVSEDRTNLRLDTYEHSSVGVGSRVGAHYGLCWAGERKLATIMKEEREEGELLRAVRWLVSIVSLLASPP